MPKPSNTKPIAPDERLLAIGGRAVHIPYALTWGHEHAVADCDVPTLGSMRELPGWLAAHG